MTGNPFAILGFSPEFFRDLDDETIGKIIDNHVKGLLKIYHPDVAGGDKQKAQAINEAADLIDPKKSPATFRQFKDEFLKKSPVKAQVAKLKQELSDARQASQRLNDVLQSYLRAWISIGDEPTICHVKNCVLKMHNPKNFAGLTKKDLGISYNRNPRAFFHLIIDEHGKISRQESKEKDDRSGPIVACPRKKLLGTIQLNQQPWQTLGWLIGQMREPTEIKKYLAIEQKIARQKKDPWPLDQRFELHALETVAHMLNPNLRPNAYLLSINLGEEPSIELEGRIEKII